MQGKDKQGEGAGRMGVPYYEETRGTKSSMRSSVDRCKARQAPRSFVRSSATRLCAGTVDGCLATGLSGVVNPKS